MKISTHLFQQNECVVVSEIVISARISRGLSLAEVAQKVKMLEPALLSIEKGERAPTVQEWRQLTATLGISPDAIDLGFLDELQKATVRSGPLENGFHLDLEFRDERCLKIRELLPYFAAAIDREGWERFKDWLKDENIAVPFIYNLDNQVNFRFYEQLIIHLFDLGLTDLNAAMVANYGVSKLFHGRLWKSYCQASSPYQRLKTYIQSAPYYQCAFQMNCIDEHSLQDRQLAIECTPAPFLMSRIGDYVPEVLSFFDTVRESTLLKIANSSQSFGDADPLSPPWKIEEVQSIYHGYQSSIYIMTQTPH